MVRTLLSATLLFSATIVVVPEAHAADEEEKITITCTVEGGTEMFYSHEDIPKDDIKLMCSLRDKETRVCAVGCRYSKVLPDVTKVTQCKDKTLPKNLPKCTDLVKLPTIALALVSQGETTQTCGEIVAQNFKDKTVEEICGKTQLFGTLPCK